MNKGKLIAFSAPSGTGKSTVCNSIIKKHDDTQISISATTRKARRGEKNGQHYHFLSRDEFEEKIKNNEFLEYEEVHGSYYGTLKKTVDDALANGINLLLDIDVLGALTIKKRYPESILLYMKAPSLDELKQRLLKRKTESEAEINKRLERVLFEEEKAKNFDHIIINDNLDKTIKEIEHIMFNGA